MYNLAESSMGVWTTVLPKVNRMFWTKKVMKFPFPFSLGDEKFYYNKVVRRNGAGFIKHLHIKFGVICTHLLWRSQKYQTCRRHFEPRRLTINKKLPFHPSILVPSKRLYPCKLLLFISKISKEFQSH